jgi:hypothetical protein
MSQGDARLIYSCYTLLNSLSLFRVLQCISVSCGHRHTLVNTESKRVFAFGWGSGGRLGLEVSGTAGYGIGVLSPGSRCVCMCLRMGLPLYLCNTLSSHLLLIPHASLEHRVLL